MAEYVEFHYTPLEGKITGKQVLKQTEDAINDLGNRVYELDVDEERIDEAIIKSEQAIETANSALSAVTTDRSVWKNTVAEMKATDIDLGVTAATRGKMVFNDGNGAFYGVRSKKSGDVESDDTVFLNNGNVAERIHSMNIIANGNNIIFVANVAELIDSDALIGNVYGTTGYYSANDGGAGLYSVRTKTQSDVEDGGSIIFLDNGNVAECIDLNIPRTFDTVADLKNASLFVGLKVSTKGYYSVNDGGSALYTIRSKDVADVEDGGSIIFLSNGNVAELITDGVVNVKQFGAKGDGTTDDTVSFANACAKAEKVVFVPNGIYRIKGLSISNDVDFVGDNAMFKAMPISDVSNQYAMVLSADNVSVNFKNIIFAGIGTALASTVDGNGYFVKLTECNSKFENCAFTDIDTQNHNLGTDNFSDRFGITVTAIDCYDIVFDGCEFTDLSNDEVLWVCPDTHDFTVGSVVLKNCNFHDYTAWSINIFTGKLLVENCFFNELDSTASVFNIAGDMAEFYNNDFASLPNRRDVIDSYEGGYLRVNTFTFKNNVIEDYRTSYSFLLISAVNAIITDNIVTIYGTFCRTVNYTLSSYPVSPTCMQYSADIEPQEIRISNNNISILANNTYPAVLLLIGATDISSLPVNSIRTEYVEISSNIFNYIEDSAGKGVIPFVVKTSVKKLTISDNTFINLPCANDITSSMVTALLRIEADHNVPIDIIEILKNSIFSNYEVLRIAWCLVTPYGSLTESDGYVTNFTVDNYLYNGAVFADKTKLFNAANTSASYVAPTINDYDVALTYKADWTATESNAFGTTLTDTISNIPIGTYIAEGKLPVISTTTFSLVLSVTGASVLIDGIFGSIAGQIGTVKIINVTSATNTIKLTSGQGASCTFSNTKRGGLALARIK